MEHTVVVLKNPDDVTYIVYPIELTTDDGPRHVIRCHFALRAGVSPREAELGLHRMETEALGRMQLRRYVKTRLFGKGEAVPCAELR